MHKFIMLIGGNMVNEGARAMTYLTISELKKKFPDYEPVLMSTIDYHKSEEFKNNFAFPIEDMNIACWSQHRPVEFLILAVMKRLKPATLKRFNEIMDNTELVIDISGYHLSSSFGAMQSLLYLYRIDTIRRKRIPIYILPQSIGPFDYIFPFKYIMWRRIKKTLLYPKRIYVREYEGYDLLKNQMKLEDVYLTKDMVLTGKELELKYILTDKYMQKELDIRDNSVGIIPNHRAYSASKKNDLNTIYKRCIDILLENDRNVDLLTHSSEDMKLCYSIKELFLNDGRVRVIGECLDCIEFSAIVKKYNFLIASRYHSIVHAYKQGVPCLVLGWAIKYKELLKDFEQDKYLFDVRQRIDILQIEKQLRRLICEYTTDSDDITKSLSDFKQTNVFDSIELVQDGN